MTRRTAKLPPNPLVLELRRLREYRGIPQWRAAEDMGYNYTQVKNIESGWNVATEAFLNDYATYLGCLIKEGALIEIVSRPAPNYSKFCRYFAPN